MKSSLHDVAVHFNHLTTKNPKLRSNMISTVNLMVSFEILRLLDDLQTECFVIVGRFPSNLQRKSFDS